MKITFLDKNSDAIDLNDIVLFNNKLRGRVVFKHNNYGIEFDEPVDYSFIQYTMNDYLMCCGDKYQGHYKDDTFISLFELYCNFNCEANELHVLEIIE